MFACIFGIPSQISVNEGATRVAGLLYVQATTCKHRLALVKDSFPASVVEYAGNGHVSFVAVSIRSLMRSEHVIFPQDTLPSVAKRSAHPSAA